ncbi:hypothetical protein HPB49_001954 [Dermacentor silvarum]|uniref:Uncharacterized protein n=1 Tax=Dermacentor silvarum TaxID=543639 RepID=A0ACB8C0H8_DERSI|nr:hypothetical protein HPB49_001954 [Dermacentor silvarum]
MPRNVVTFLWRTLYLQSIRRHYIATLIEIVVVGCLFYFLVFLRKPPNPLSKESDEADARLALVPTQVTHIVYAPQSDYNDELMIAVAGEIASRLNTTQEDDQPDNRFMNLIGRLESGAGIALSSIGAYAAMENEPMIAKSTLKKRPDLLPLKDTISVVTECEKLLNGTSTLNRMDFAKPLCLTLSEATSQSPNISLVLYAPVDAITDDMAKYELGSLPDSALSSYMEKATVFQQIIEQEHLKLQSKAHPEAEMDYNEHQGVMGLSDAEFFWGHFLTALIIGVVESAICVLIMCQAKHEGTTYAKGIDPTLLMVSFIIAQIGYSLLIILITWVFPKGGAKWSLVTERVLGKDNVTIAEIWAVMLVADAAFAFLAWYLSKVLPWSTDNPQHPLFCLQVYGYKPALNGVDMKVYESKITVLLGHNGAGKTTLMSILTGMKAPTSGVAIVCGYDVSKQRYHVRQLVSLCQQTDIFFDDMTCTENLLYFGSLKGTKKAKLVNSITETLRVVGLEDKAYSMPHQLSGGMKRRLSIAITLVSEPELLILDEPTAGMDPETRRCVWDTLQNVAKKSTLLLSSHDMEEADAIGDQIIVMANGVAVCSGSTAFLKKACGVGYKLTFTKVPKAFDLNQAMAIVHNTIPKAVVDDDKESEVSIMLGTTDPTGFSAMFKELESSLEKLGITSIGVTVASMKDVYLK